MIYRLTEVADGPAEMAHIERQNAGASSFVGLPFMFWRDRDGWAFFPRPAGFIIVPVEPAH